MQCPHFIAFHALGIAAGIAGIVVGIARVGSGNLRTKRFVREDLYASRIQKDPPDLSLVCIQIIFVYKVQKKHHRNL